MDFPKCYFCNINHRIDHVTRNKIVLTTEIPNDGQYLDGWSFDDESPIHEDMEGVENGFFPVLRRALLTTQLKALANTADKCTD